MTTDQQVESMTTTNAMRLASLVTAINVLVASGFSIAAIIRPQYLVPAESVPTEASLLMAMYAAWCICFTDPCGSRRKPSADERTLRPGTSKFAPVAR